MSLDPQTPVLVGVGAVQQRLDDPSQALEPVELMIASLQRAGADAGAPQLLAAADEICIPRGFWDYPDPGRLIADRFAARQAKTTVAEIGVLQTTLLAGAIESIASGAAQVVLITGGEAKYRALRAQMTGVEAVTISQSETVADRVLRPAQEIWSQREADLGLLMPVNQYSIMENALRYAEHRTIAEHRREIAEMWAGFNRVAVDNPQAWNRSPVSVAEILSDERNRMLAFPYAKLHNSQWNVDQAAGIILCSLRKAQALGIPESKWVFPQALAESNHMLPLSQRRALHRAPGFRIAGERALQAAQRRIDEVAHLELYSCFPIAVRMQQRELGVPAGRPLTVTGGMAFAGGPLNNFVLQALVRMAEVLRVDRGSCGMVNAVSGMLTKQGVSLWSTQPPRTPCEAVDVSGEVAALTESVEVVDDYEGPASIASYTVIYDGGIASRAVVICDLPDGSRRLLGISDPQQAASMTNNDPCGKAIVIAGDTIVA